jgi:hypothetical protein
MDTFCMEFVVAVVLSNVFMPEPALLMIFCC